MNQKIKYLVLLTLISGLASPTASAASGQKATEEELAAEAAARVAADSGLQTQINTIELTPGPQGLTGATGQQGADGAQGPQGEQGVNADNDELFSRIADLETSLAAYEARFANSDIDGDGYTPADGDCDDADNNAFPGGFPNDCGVTTLTYEIGGMGPAGGIVFYVTIGGKHGLEAAPSDISASEWGCRGYYIGTQTTIGSGVSNTHAIVGNACSYLGGMTAARLVDDYELNGFTDWFLPSKDELNQLYNNRVVVGGFALGIYWSSSQSDNNNAWVQGFFNGSQNAYDKGFIYEVRAVRAF